MIVNRSLLRKALPIPEEAVMYDYWFMLVAAAFGRIAHMDEPTVLYRRHERNVFEVEAPRREGLGATLARLRTAWIFRHKGYYLDPRILQQANALLLRFRDELSAERRSLLEDFLQLPMLPPKKRKVFLLKHRIFPYGLLGNLELLLGI